MHAARRRNFKPALHGPLVAFPKAATGHPLEDGNGRITRALTDRALAQADQSSIRMFAMSEAILEHRKAYCDVLERTVFKTKFWTRHSDKPLLEPQRKVLNRLLGGDFQDSDFQEGINAT